MNSRRQFVTLLAGGIFALGSHHSLAQSAGANVPVQGQVLSRSSGAPVPGVSAYLVHRTLGRSALSYTDAYGRFGWSAIPAQAEPYYVEIYWGQNLIYRQPATIRSATTLPAIRL
jgi:hypothetical protein